MPYSLFANNHDAFPSNLFSTTFSGISLKYYFQKLSPNHEPEDIGDYETKPEFPQQIKCAKHFMDLEMLLDAAQFYLGDVREFLKSPSGHRYLMDVSKRYLESYLDDYRNRLHGGEHTLELP